ncbi:MAG: GntR family transcriptional regulator [Armatimonadota bacterium]|nr:GntR family transcriptional regulator [Armatimonadota bacterium]MDR7459966.1 GntR family transcriptional regulator [Armatimonadota bacterium]MDR7479588.1 GntR family transcriptional regulator [Armatimonadota bacterium]MDR7490561.1 GntR family transcriptional regulator [Armatimonadota bacterium]MDR7526549.1 GntR family transcriptional regulator [Armatimonadota bacterium]
MVLAPRLAKLDVYERLRQMIVEEELKPGQRLAEEWLASRLGASRTPIREALQRLEGDGLVLLRPRRGAIVRPFTLAELIRLFELRVRLEEYAARLSALNITAAELTVLQASIEEHDRVLTTLPASGAGRTAGVRRLVTINQEFHRAIHEASRNEHVLVMLNRLQYFPLVYRTIFLQDDLERRISLQHHEQLVYALHHRDAELAESVMRAHVLHGRLSLVRHVRSPDGASTSAPDKGRP